MDITIFTPYDFNKLEKAWKSLEKGADMTCFQSYEWCAEINRLYLNRAYKNNVRAFYILATENNIPVMIAPVHYVKHGVSIKGLGINKGGYIIGTTTHSDYLSFIYNEFSPECFEAILTFIAEEFKIKKFFFEQVISGTELDQYLSKRNNSIKINQATCVKIIPEENYETYNKSLSKSVRQNIRTANNRAVKDNINISIEVCNSVNEETATTLYNIYRRRVASQNTVVKDSLKAKLISTYYKKYNEKLAQRLSESNYLTRTMQKNSENNFILIIKGNQTPIGFCFGLKNDDSISVMIVTFDEAYSKYSPGMLGISSFIKSSYETGNPVTLDLTKGNEKYKYDLGGQEHYLNYYCVKI